MAICEQCKLDASELIGRSTVAGGKNLCRPCFERAERAQREASPEEVARKAQFEAEMEAQHRRQEAERLRPDPPELTCRYGQCTDGSCRPAVGIRNGLLACAECLRAELPGHPEAPIVTLERRVVVLEATLAAQQAPKGSRKAVV